MKRQLLWLALAMSALFNVFFAAGYFKARAQTSQPQAHRDVMMQVTRELDLDATQRETFARLRQDLDAEVAACDGALSLVNQETGEEFRKPKPDVDRLRDMFDRAAEIRRQKQLARSSTFSQFLGVLTPEQRQRFSRRGPGDRRHGPPPHLLKQYDADRDGRLDPLERETARKAMEGRFHPGERLRIELRRQFDANKDGNLDDEEWLELKRWLENGPRRSPESPRV